MSYTPPEELTAVFQFEKVRRENWCVIHLEGDHIANGTCSPGELVPGVTYRFFGKWTEFKGVKQFRFSSFVQAVPHSRRGVVLYLEKYCPGVGASTANQLVDLYGEDALSVIKQDPERVSRETRLTLSKAREAAEALKRIEGIQATKIELIDLFAGRGFFSESIDLAIKKWGAMAPTKIKRDPFCLLTPPRFPGAGFSRVDKLYQELGHPSDRMKRQVHCAIYTIEEDGSGSTWVSFAEIERRINDLVTGDVDADKACRIAVRCGLISREDRDGQSWYAIRRVADAEIYTVKRVMDLMGGAVRWDLRNCPELPSIHRPPPLLPANESKPSSANDLTDLTDFLSEPKLMDSQNTKSLPCETRCGVELDF